MRTAAATSGAQRPVGQRRRRSRLARAALAAASAIALPATAQTLYVGGNNGTWNSTGSSNPNWLDSSQNQQLFIPQSGSDVVVGVTGNGGASNSTVVFNITVPAPGYTSLTVDSVNSVSQTGAATVMLVSGLESIGSASGNGGSDGGYVQSAGSNQAATLQLGSGSRATGSYRLSGGTVSATVIAQIGYAGGGLFNQIGGTVNAAALTVGALAGSSGTASISAGVMSVTGALTVGDAGAGTLNYTGGSLLAGSLNVGNVGGTGAISLANGVSLNVGSQIIGNGGVGTYAQTGSASNVASTFTVGSAATGNGTATIGGGALQVSNGGTLALGLGGTGKLFQSGGVVRTPTLLLGTTDGTTPSSFGFYSMSNGAVLQVTGDAAVGHTGFGIFNQSGGATTIGGALNVGPSGSNNAFVIITGGTLSAASTTNSGVIQQTAGVASYGPMTGTSSGRLIVGGASGATALARVTSLQQSAVTVNAGGTLAVATNAATFTNLVASLTIAAGGTFDLANHNMIASTAASTMRQYLVNGFAGGAWNGTATGGNVGSIVSLAASAAPASASRSIGYASAADVAASLVSPNAASQIGAGQTLLMYTTPADFNLDGKTDFNDFLALQNHYNQSGDWATGDANYDGKVDFNDFLILQNNYNHQLPAPSLPASEVAAIPEPAGLSLLAISSTLLLARRRRIRQDVILRERSD